MDALDIKRINDLAPYKVELIGQEYIFESYFGLQYAVSFDPETMFEDMWPAYWLNLSNRSGQPSPSDTNVKLTIICILEEFFRVNPDILLYMCDSAGGQQAMRSRLFLRWFHSYGLQADYFTQTEMIHDEGEENYVALIVKRSHPHLNDIIDFFNEQIKLFRENK